MSGEQTSSLNPLGFEYTRLESLSTCTETKWHEFQQKEQLAYLRTIQQLSISISFIIFSSFVAILEINVEDDGIIG